MTIPRYSAAIAVLIAVASSGHGQTPDQKAALQQALNGQFTATKVSGDRMDIVTAGTVLVFQKDGVMMYSTASPKPPLNNYKNGKISQGMGGFGRDLAITMASGGEGTAADYPQRKFVTGETCWFVGSSISKDGIVFQLYSDIINDVRYYAELKFPFDKKSVPSPAEALAKIAEVVTVKPDDPAASAPAANQPAVLQNDDIIKMAKAGLEDSIIVAKIKSSQCQFDTSTDALISLKQNHVSSAVLRAMMAASKSQ